ncbi:MAG TPA: hypothetical protein VFW83_07575, partial [Bryobacteraceae bacterium]|nr:hypothetical protein [Bryobacteraceae bacterium]
REMTADRIAEEAFRLLEDDGLRAEMRAGLAEAADKLKSGRDPMETAADWAGKIWSEKTSGVKTCVE